MSHKDSKEDETQKSGVFNIDIMKQFAKGLFIVLLIYVMGYYGFSSLFIILPFTSWFLAKKYTNVGHARQLFAMDLAENEEKTISRLLKDLPTWVYFPDVERVAWLNKIIHSLWPSLEGYIWKYLKDQIEPGLKKKITSFEFTKINLGDMPLKIHGVKVYTDKASDNEIFMEMHIAYVGDCDFEVSVQGIKAGIEDILFKGTIFILMKPLVHQMPFIGGVQVYFREQPEIQLNWTNKANILDFPVIKDTLLDIVHQYLAGFMLFPNKFSYKLITKVPDKIIHCPEPKGVLRIKVIEAKKLMKKDLMTSDPYAVISVGSKSYQTPVIDSNLNPIWNFTCEAVIEDPYGKVHFNIQDFDKISKGDLLGRTSLDILQIQKEGTLETWLKLDDATSGEIHIEATWLELSSDLLKLRQYNPNYTKTDNQATCVLILYVESGDKLPNAEKILEPSPYVTIKSGVVTETTIERKETNNPVWNKGFYFLISDPEHQHFSIDVKDKKTEKSLGNLQYFIKDLLSKDKLLEYRPFHLKNSGVYSEIKLFIQLKIMDQVQREVTEAKRESYNLEKDITPVERPIPSETENTSDVAPTPDFQDNDESGNNIAQPLLTSKAIDVESSNTLRKRGSGQNDPGKCSLHLTLRYSMQRQALVVVVHKIRNLPASNPSDLPDPYVKMFLRPGSQKDSKRKTVVVKNNSNPEYDETFEYIVNPQELNSNTLEVFVCLWNSSIFKHGKVLAKTLIELAELDLTKSVTEWFELDINYSNGGNDSKE